MYDFKEPWKIRIAGIVNTLLTEAGLAGNIGPSAVIAEIPPKPELGDLGFPMFGFAKLLRKAPPQIAQAVAAGLGKPKQGESFTAEGPYVNIRLNRAEAAAAILGQIRDPSFGRPATLAGSRIMVEFSSPNTNKPLHLGHLRNDVLGESVSRILAACGAEVRKVCIINDRGVHICKSMLAYRKYGQGKTPESEGVKSDHFVGDWYVKFHAMSKENPAVEEEAQEMLRRWEQGDGETVALWEKMREWTVTGMKETYRRTGVSFDEYYYESQTYLSGREEVRKGLERRIFYREEDGSV
ncbi:MAG: arginine--tRNA ligase, partial [Treponema sp.]|nr:arginine--tRNA ligase [Treponema sp.]